ncbi:hypothetical protein ACGFIY_10150 [Micromonospora chersina]|uniref:hypothetical protein n=1 Tax=Micromonospora chersina TaxID=47854 RepID=UPI00371197D3
MIAVALGLMACLAVPAGWAVVKTVQAGQGEPTPIAAANAYLLAVFETQDGLGVDRCLCDELRADLLRDGRQLREQLAANAGPGVKVESSDWKTIDDGTVSAMVNLRFTQVDAITGSVMLIAGTSHEWRFYTKQERGIDAGWKVCRVDAPPLCGTHLRC